MKYYKNRRAFINIGAKGLMGLGLAHMLGCQNKKIETSIVAQESMFFKISLAQWSLHKSIEAKTEDPSLFPLTARQKYDIGAVEYVNQFYIDEVNNVAYWNSLKKQAEDQDVKSLLIMVDDEGDLGNLNDEERIMAAKNHH